MQYCLSVLQDSDAQMCKCNFSSSLIEKSPVDWSQGCGRSQVGGNQALIEKFVKETRGIRWQMRTSDVLLQPTSALRFL